MDEIPEPDPDDEAVQQCEHEEGERIQAYDSDGCGYYLWVCKACGWATVDPMP